MGNNHLFGLMVINFNFLHNIKFYIIVTLYKNKNIKILECRHICPRWIYIICSNCCTLHAKEAISMKNPRNVADIWQDLDSYPRHRKEKGNKAEESIDSVDSLASISQSIKML